MAKIIFSLGILTACGIVFFIGFSFLLYLFLDLILTFFEIYQLI